MEAMKKPEFGLLRTIEAWMRRVHSREQLKALSDRALRDIGLTRQEVDREIRKPFWRA